MDMTQTEAKAILRKVSVQIMDYGSAKIESGTPESKALITLWGEKSKPLMPDQRSSNDQLQDAAALADQAGLYDAADAIRRMISKG